MRGPLLLLLSTVLCAPACDPVERQADALADLRDQAAAGIAAAEAFCTERDSVVARAQRGEPGADRLLQEVLLSPVVVDDYCNEFRFHAHEEPEAARGGTAPADTSGEVSR